MVVIYNHVEIFVPEAIPPAIILSKNPEAMQRASIKNIFFKFMEYRMEIVKYINVISKKFILNLVEITTEIINSRGINI